MPRLRTDFGYIIYWQESGGSYYVGGFADPIMAVQTLEEQTAIDGFVWCGSHDLVSISCIRASEIQKAEVEYERESWKSTLSHL